MAGVKLAPLSEITPWNSPLARGEADSMLTAKPPAEWPRMVTLPGSPPNLEILACTHFRPAIWSSRPYSPEPWPLSRLSAGVARKPNGPTR